MFFGGAFLIGIVFTVISLAVSGLLRSKFKKYSRTPINSGLSGKEVAELMLRDHGIYDVRVISTPGQLTDHYNPTNKTVNLSAEVYEGRNASAAAVASHECGHAIQHANAYSMLKFRTAMVPLQNISAQIMNMVVMVGLFGGFFLGQHMWQSIILIVVGAYLIFTLFSFVTLPVEFDASKRALAWVKERNILSGSEHGMAKDALFWASMTYVVAAVGSLATLLYYLSMLTGSDE